VSGELRKTEEEEAGELRCTRIQTILAGELGRLEEEVQNEVQERRKTRGELGRKREHRFYCPKRRSRDRVVIT